MKTVILSLCDVTIVTLLGKSTWDISSVAVMSGMKACYCGVLDLRLGDEISLFL